MAELTDPSACCTAQAQSTCCEPDAKAACCGTAAAGGGCGCAEGRPDVRELVRETYAAAARGAASGLASCCPREVSVHSEAGEAIFGAGLYGEEGAAAGSALRASLGCGVPTAVADLHAGEIVLDLGSGAGGDVLISAARVGPAGRAIGLDMTDEMLDLARRNAAAAGADNVEFLKGHIEAIPLAAACVDVVISNCVINLSGDKPQALREAGRVLRPGGRLAVSDVVADADMDGAVRADMAAYTGCIAGALTREEFQTALTAAGLVDVEITETHRVHPAAASALIRARKPLPLPGACSLDADRAREQGRRYREIGVGAHVTERAPRRLRVTLAPDCDASLVEATLAVERECCPVFDLRWDPAARVLELAVADEEQAPALDAIAGALGV